MSVFVIIPAYNECEKVADIIKRVKRYCKNVVVVDDGSSDGTCNQVNATGAILLQHKVNLGKGAALKTGCDYAYKSKATKIIVIDSDGQHQPKEIPHFIDLLDNHDIVFGYRKQSTQMPFVMRFGNGFINGTLKTLFNISIKDSQCGYRGFTADAYEKIRWNASDYYIETEMIIKAAKHRLQYGHIPIETIYSDNYKGTTVVDGMKIVLKMIGARIIK